MDIYLTNNLTNQKEQFVRKDKKNIKQINKNQKYYLKYHIQKK